MSKMMGDIANAILDGEFCQHCGVIMDDQIPPKSWFVKQKLAKRKSKEFVYDCDVPGYPRSCKSCKEE